MKVPDEIHQEVGILFLSQGVIVQETMTTIVEISILQIIKKKGLLGS